MSKVTRITLNSGEIANFLADSTDIREVVEESAKRVENALPGALEESRGKASSSSKLKPQYSQVIYNNEGKARDGRFQARVGIRNASGADFIYNTLGSAVVRAGGHFSGR